MAAVTLDGKRFVVYEVTQKEYSARGTRYPQRTHLRILEIDHEELFKRLLMGKTTLNRVNDPVVKRVVKDWEGVYVQNYKYTLTKATEECKQLNERNQND